MGPLPESGSAAAAAAALGAEREMRDGVVTVVAEPMEEKKVKKGAARTTAPATEPVARAVDAVGAEETAATMAATAAMATKAGRQGWWAVAVRPWCHGHEARSRTAR